MAIKTKIYSKKIKSNRNSRILAIQSIYAFETLEHKSNISELILDILSIHDLNVFDLDESSPINTKYVVKLVKGVIENIDHIDKKASKYLASDWRLDRLPKLVKTIIRVGIFELEHTKELNPAILIDEYLEIAKLFEHTGEAGFINSILDQVLKEKE